MTTNANVRKADSSHWYYQDGKPCFELPKKDGTGMKVPTLADARKLNLVPSVTTILKVVHKEGLVNWLIEQAVLAVLTTPRKPDETEDAYTKRVLSEERVQDEETEIARDRGTEIHAALADLFRGETITDDLKPWVMPVYERVRQGRQVVAVEKPLVGTGYAGTADLILSESICTFDLWDWKTTKNLPEKESWPEHRLQLAAYARAWQQENWDRQNNICVVRVGNAYISTVEPGQFKIFQSEWWINDYDQGFMPLVSFWQWSKGYKPERAVR